MKIIRKNRMRLLGLSLLFSVVILGLWFLNVNKVEVAHAEWFDEAWHYRRAFTIDQTKIDADLTDFPVAVNFLQRDWRTNIDYSKTKSSGADIRFTDFSGTLLSYEIEKWDTTATSTVWVKLPKVHDKTDTVFYLYYGNPSASDNQTQNEVWDANFKGVWHLDEAYNVASDDSTREGNDGTHTNFYSATSTVDAKLDGGIDFDGTDDYVGIGVDAVFGGGITHYNFTIEAWIKPRIADWNNRAVFSEFNPGIDTDFNVYSHANGVVFYNGGKSTPASLQSNPIVADTWYHVAFVTGDSPAESSWYINGNLSTTTPNNIWIRDDQDKDQRIGVGEGTASLDRYDGLIDEVRVSNVARSADWIKADYNSGNDTLLTYGTQEIGPGPSGWWRMDEGQGSTAYNSGSATSTDGAISGAAWQSEDMCVSGRCLYFDGTDDVVTVTEHPPINLSTHSSTTIEAWFKPASTGEGDVGQIVQKGSATYIRVIGGIGGMGIEASLDLATTDATLTVNNAVATSTWTHLALVYDDDADDEIDLYVNGVWRVASTNGAGSLVTDNNNLLIGGITTANFHGFIDEVKIYPYARTVAQIKTGFASRGASKGVSARIGNDPRDLSDALQLYLKMDETQQNTCTGGVNDACDSSGVGRDGAWTGNATSTGSGKFGSGTTYDGTGDYIEVPDFDL